VACWRRSVNPVAKVNATQHPQRIDHSTPVIACTSVKEFKLGGVADEPDRSS
jgi:hypothetical protein